MPVYKLYIKEQSGNDLVDYQVRIQLENIGFTDWANLTADSIYFTDANGNPLYFWVEYLDITNKRGVIWVKIPSIPKNSTVVINLNYGGTNPYPSYHDPKNVFVFFDHFDDPTETLTIESCTWTRDTANSVINVSGTGNCFAWKDIGLSNVKIISRLKQNVSGVHFGHVGRVKDTQNLIQTYWHAVWSALVLAKVVNNTWSEIARSSYSITTGAWYRFISTFYQTNIKLIAYKDDFTGEGSVSGSASENMTNTIHGLFTYVGSSTNNMASYDYLGIAKHVDPDPAVVGENQLLSLGSVYYDYQETLITGSIYYDGIQTLNLGSIYYDGIEAVAPPTLPPQILCPEFADILSQSGYSWEKAIASILCGLEAVLTELGNEISRSAKTIGLVFIGVGFGYMLMITGEKIIRLILRGLRKSYEKKR